MGGTRLASLAGSSLILAALCALAAPAGAAPKATAIEPGEMGLPAVPTSWKPTKPVGTSVGPVTADLLAKGASDPSQWLLYGGDYRNHRISPVKSLTPANVKRLRVAWSAPTGTTGQFSTSPIIYGGVMYITTSYNRLIALDARTGEFLWRQDVTLPSDMRICCGPANRGAAIAGDLLIMATLDARLMAFDRKTGTPVWNSVITNYRDGYSSTSAPLVVGDLVYIGVGGGEFGAIGLITAFDIKTGKQAWQLRTVPQAGEPGVQTWAGDSWKSGGAPTWATGTYDADTDTLLWTSGNPSPDWNGDARAGDNLYSDSVLAIEPKTGKLKWHFQFTPHDVWDFDGNSHFFLIDTVIGGKPVKALVQPNRNGYFYILDRTNGRFLRATQYVEQLNWAKGIDRKGRPIVDPAAKPQENPTMRVCPSSMGGTNGAWTSSYDPASGLIFAASAETCQTLTKGIAVHVKGIPFMGGMPELIDAKVGKGYGLVSAIDVKTGQIKWRYKDPQPMMAGVLATAGGVLFTSNTTGEALAIDQATGEKLWSFRMGGAGRGQPVVYELDGKPYVAIPSGGAAMMDMMLNGGSMLPEGGQLFVFSLAD